jgi:crossover junction endodeoxyribonuclease RuvC
MFVLGIDPGLSTTGYGIVDASGRRPAAVAAGVIRTDPKAAVGTRLAELYADLTAVIEEYGPDEAAVEQVFVNRNLQTATMVGRASGVILLALAQAGLRTEEYTPSAVKMALCGFGNAPKEQMMRVISMRLGLPAPPSPADASDALAIALCHLQSAPLARAIGERR